MYIRLFRCPTKWWRVCGNRILSSIIYDHAHTGTWSIVYTSIQVTYVVFSRRVTIEMIPVVPCIIMSCIFSFSPKQPRTDSPDVKLSKFLSYVCRHGAEKEGLQLHDGEKCTQDSSYSQLAETG